MSTFFRNVDTRYEDPVDLPFNAGKTDIKSLKARAILVDMEQGVVSETLNGPIGELFDTRQLLTDISGSGNNWYMKKMENMVVNLIIGLMDIVCMDQSTEMDFWSRFEERQSFAILCNRSFSCTRWVAVQVMENYILCIDKLGSGLGTYILGLLADEYPDVYRFVNGRFIFGIYI